MILAEYPEAIRFRKNVEDNRGPKSQRDHWRRGVQASKRDHWRRGVQASKTRNKDKKMT